jgi:hypothetical protein
MNNDRGDKNKSSTSVDYSRFLLQPFNKNFYSNQPVKVRATIVIMYI